MAYWKMYLYKQTSPHTERISFLRRSTASCNNNSFFIEEVWLVIICLPIITEVYVEKKESSPVKEKYSISTVELTV